MSFPALSDYSAKNPTTGADLSEYSPNLPLTLKNIVNGNLGKKRTDFEVEHETLRECWESA